MTKPNPRSILAVAAAAALLPAAVAGAQDPGTPPPADAAPVNVTVKVPSKVTKKQFAKGVTATVTCDRACNARLSFAGPTGIVTQTSGAVAAGASKAFKLKAPAFMLKAIKKNSTYTLSVQARGDDGGIGQASKKVKFTK
jgi:hypothetical protein